MALFGGGSLVIAALSVVLALVPAGADDFTSTCAGRPATRVGTPGDDILTGTAGDDVIIGGGGDDRISAGPGHDVICGGPGRDAVDGGGGDDLILGAEGDDDLNGNAGNDRLSGGGGADRLAGELGTDVLLGGPGDDLLRGGGGDDRLFGHDGDDELAAGEGDDFAIGGAGSDTVRGGLGADELQGGADTDLLEGDEQADRIYAGPGDDYLTGGEGDDLLRGNGGRDLCDGGDGWDDADTCEQLAATEAGQLPAPLYRPGPNQVALTFDDGPGAYTPQILSVLDRYDAPATFFVVGASAVDHPDLVRRMAAAGHSVQSHTYGHYWLTRYPDATVADQLARGSAVIENITGIPPACFRPPFGAVNDRVRSIAADLGLTSIMWGVDPWDFRHPGPAAVASHVLSRADGGDIVLFHDQGGWSTYGALPAIIEGLRARGLELVTICSTALPPPEAAGFSAPAGAQ